MNEVTNIKSIKEAFFSESHNNLAYSMQNLFKNMLPVCIKANAIAVFGRLSIFFMKNNKYCTLFNFFWIYKKTLDLKLYAIMMKKETSTLKVQTISVVIAVIWICNSLILLPWKKTESVLPKKRSCLSSASFNLSKLSFNTFHFLKWN